MSVRAKSPGLKYTVKSRGSARTVKNCPRGYVCTRKAHFEACPRDYVRVSNGRCRKLRRDEYHIVYKSPWKYFSKTELDKMNYSVQELLDRNATREDLLALGYSREELEGLEATTLKSELSPDEPEHLHERITPASTIMEPDAPYHPGSELPAPIQDTPQTISGPIDQDTISERPEIEQLFTSPTPEPMPEPPEPMPEPPEPPEPMPEPIPEPIPEPPEPMPEPSEPMPEPSEPPEPPERREPPEPEHEPPHMSDEELLNDEAAIDQRIKDFDFETKQHLEKLNQLSDSVEDE